MLPANTLAMCDYRQIYAMIYTDAGQGRSLCVAMLCSRHDKGMSRLIPDSKG